MSSEFSTVVLGKGSRHHVLEASLNIGSDAGRDELLTDGVFSVVTFLSDSMSESSVESATVVIAVGEESHAPASQAFVEAVRGLVQTFTLERSGTNPASNVVVCADSVTNPDVKEALEFLQSTGGQFSRGSTFDLRSES